MLLWKHIFGIFRPDNRFQWQSAEKFSDNCGLSSVEVSDRLQTEAGSKKHANPGQGQVGIEW